MCADVHIYICMYLSSLSLSMSLALCSVCVSVWAGCWVSVSVCVLGGPCALFDASFVLGEGGWL